MVRGKRTDMAAELLQDVQGELGEQRGIIVRESSRGEFSVQQVDVTNEEGARLIGKDMGSYFTVKLPKSVHFDSKNCADCLSSIINKLTPGKAEGGGMVACLGNPNITPDALGPLAAEYILVTRHLCLSGAEEFSALHPVSLCRPGVLAASGVESAERLSAFSALVQPSLIVVVDALAGRELSGLCRSIQLSDSGIAPGSGVGNDRARIDRTYLGVPVISIGVPTVTDVEADTGERLFVTCRDIDQRVRTLAKTISLGINLAFQPKLSCEDILSFVE